ncbi:MAG TPA: endo-1,4-beta-xylanase [Gemmatimonadaceae bacterium]|nr:endo-1,4-beta-xylanase [Gemmatimonadaceae bacterium]
MSHTGGSLRNRILIREVRQAVLGGAILIALAAFGCSGSGEKLPTDPTNPGSPTDPSNPSNPTNPGSPGTPPPPPPPPPGSPAPVIGALRAAAAARGFLIGAAVQADPLSEGTPYADTVGAEYNVITPANAMKFADIHPKVDTYAFADAVKILAFALARSNQVRGHTLVWHNQLPQWVQGLLPASSYSNCATVPAATRETIRGVLRDHITTVVSHFRGQLLSWDVVNEAYTDGSRPTRRNTIWQCALGSSYIDSSFVWARRADPGAKLFYNDYGAEGRNAKSDSVLNLVKTLKAKGIPIGGVGLEMHGALQTSRATDFIGPTAADVGSNMDNLIASGVEVHITEMDVPLRNPTTPMRAAQGGVYANMLGVCLARPKCTAFVTWGFTDLYFWTTNPTYPVSSGWTEPLVFSTSYVHKPAFDSLLVRLAR